MCALTAVSDPSKRTAAGVRDGPQAAPFQPFCVIAATTAQTKRTVLSVDSGWPTLGIQLYYALVVGSANNTTVGSVEDGCHCDIIRAKCLMLGVISVLTA